MGGQERLVTVEVPESLALQLRPELSEVSEGRTNYQDPPFTGEAREEKFGDSGRNGIVVPSLPTILCTLSRAWPLIGFAVNPGNLTGGGGVNVLAALLFVLLKGQRALVSTTLISGGLGAVAVPPILIGAKCELAVEPNAAATPNPLVGVTATLWGSNVR
jgi:hypothetical protein